MKQTFEEWCEGRLCSECKYDKYGSMSACRIAFEEDMKEFGNSDFRRIEKKLDAIIKHFNVPVE